MFDYTKAAVKKTADDFKRIDYLRNVITQILYIAYLIYALFAGAGVRPANAILFGLSVAYLAFFLFVSMGKASKLKKKKLVSRIFTRCKQLIKLFTLGVMIYGIYATTTHVTPLSVILSAMMIVGWILQIVFEVILKYFLSKAQFILEGLEADYENITKPVKTVGNFFKKLSGKEPEPEKEKTKSRVWLDNKVAENRAEREEQKRESKREKKRAQKQERLNKKQARIDRKNTVFLPEAEEKAAEPEAVEVFEEPKLLE